MRVSHGSTHSDEDANQYMETGEVNHEQLNNNNNVERVNN